MWPFSGHAAKRQRTGTAYSIDWNEKPPIIGGHASRKVPPSVHVVAVLVVLNPLFSFFIRVASITIKFDTHCILGILAL